MTPIYSFQEFVRLCQPFLLGLVLDYITDINQDNAIPDRLGYTYAALLTVSIVINVFLHIHSYYMGEAVGMRIRSAYTSLIYEKVSFQKRTLNAHN